jgi:hypothetical protein
MATQPIATPKVTSAAVKPAKAHLLENATNEVVFAVVGYVGSGTSEIAAKLKGLLENTALPGGQFDVEILKARKVIEDWATRNGETPPSTPQNDLATTRAFQDLGDKMRKGDHALVARDLIGLIRLTRASKLGITNPGEEPVRPDGARRAYILDSIRHPAEVELLRRVYQEAFVLVGIVCEAKVRQQRIVNRYTNAGVGDAEKFMARDSRAVEKYGQRVSDAFHMADFFVDNTVEQFVDGEPNADWDISDKLSRLTASRHHRDTPKHGAISLSFVSRIMCTGGENRGMRHDRHLSAASSFQIGVSRGRRMASSGRLARVSERLHITSSRP